MMMMMMFLVCIYICGWVKWREGDTATKEGFWLGFISNRPESLYVTAFAYPASPFNVSIPSHPISSHQTINISAPTYRFLTSLLYKIEK